MALTPLDIHHKEFKTARFGGYNEEEVDSFLDQVADEFERLIQENVDLKQQIEHSKKRLSEFEEMQTSLQSALLAATKSAEAVRDQARQESEAIVSQAREGADSMVSGAQEQAKQLILRAEGERQKLERSLTRLKEIRRSYILSIRDLADAHLVQVSEIESEKDEHVIEEPPEPDLQEIAEAKAPPPIEKPPAEMPPVVNPPERVAPKAVPTEPPDSEPTEPPVKAAVKPLKEEEAKTTDGPQAVTEDSTGSGASAPKAKQEKMVTAPPVAEKPPVAKASTGTSDNSSVKKGAKAVSVKQESEADSPQSSKLVEEVLSIDGDEDVFGEFAEDGNGEGRGSAGSKNRKEKRDKHFFWE
ncbi:MAG: DivIVA domain-containing protein [Actinobacteria bacterium]|nr:DivIVA domain-containing protein [Actinomycetota bacterium]MCG2796565.1 DivIVA domain-containing protein [Actinomycetes bacterium]